MKKYQNPFRTLTRFEWGLWLSSLVLLTVLYFMLKDRNPMTLAASLVGVTGLVFVAKGDPVGQIFIVFFSLFYAVVSLEFRYYGEMITYVGMSAPAAVLATIEWFKNPAEKGKNEVRVARLSKKKWLILVPASIVVTVVFYFILKYFGTANLLVSTLSVATSFFAAMLTYLRSPFYGLGYAANDIVLIVMWIMASVVDISYFPMVLCFVVFLVNDCYGFFNWRRIERRQRERGLAEE